MAKKERDEFSDFDDLFASIQDEIDIIDGKQGGLVPKGVIKASSAPMLVSATDPYIWDRRKIELMVEDPELLKPVVLTLNDFCKLLEQNADFFVWDKFEDGRYLRAWDKEGWSYDPVTAVVRSTRMLCLSLCVTDLAGQLLGLSRQVAKELAYICWNPEPECLRGDGISGLRRLVVEDHSEDKFYLRDLRTRLIETIQRGISKNREVGEN